MITHHPRSVFPSRFSYLILSKKVEQNERMLKLFNAGLRKLQDSGKYDQYFEESRSGQYLARE